jgi:hypothetical protein
MTGERLPHNRALKLTLGSILLSLPLWSGTFKGSFASLR